VANLADLSNRITTGDFQQDNGDIVMTAAFVSQVSESLESLIAIVRTQGESDLFFINQIGKSVTA
jgi:hypothetical protein